MSRPLLRKSAASLLDQVALSGLNFVIGLILIRWVSKADYGLYTTLFAAGILATTFLDALIGTSVTTLSARLPAHERLSYAARALRLHLLASLGLGLLFALSAIGLLAEAHLPTPELLSTSAAFGAYVVTLGAREFCRTAHFIEGQPGNVLQIDAVFVLATLLAGLALAQLGAPSLAEVLTTLAAANLLASARPVWRLVQLRLQARADLPPNPPAPLRQGSSAALLRQLWPLSRWALPGALIGWLCNYSYLYFAGALLGLTASADLNAARILLIPIGLMGVAWSRVARPMAGQLIAQQEWPGLSRLARQSLLGIEGVTWLYVLLLGLAFPWLASHLLGDKYRNVEPLLWLWGVYFSINAARTIGTTWLAAFGAFKPLFWLSLGSFGVLCAALAWLMPRHGAAGAIMALILIEALELIVSWAWLLPRARKAMQAAGDPR